jgi:hypothetical protein
VFLVGQVEEHHPPQVGAVWRLVGLALVVKALRVGTINLALAAAAVAVLEQLEQTPLITAGMVALVLRRLLQEHQHFTQAVVGAEEMEQVEQVEVVVVVRVPI